MPHCLEITAWRAASAKEVAAFHTSKPDKNSPPRSRLVVKSRLNQVDVYSYLRARFGVPNGFQNYLRKDDSDNLVHWDFNLKVQDVDVYLSGRMCDIAIIVSEEMTDEDWKALILAIKGDFGRLGQDKSKMLRSFEKYVVFQNKFCALADLCADLHASIVDAPKAIQKLPRLTSKRSARKLKSAMKKVTKRAKDLYGDCLKLRLLTPIMAEAFLNMVIITLCKDEIRNDLDAYNAFIREKIPQRLELLHTNCSGFVSGVDQTTDAYKNFLRVMNARNFIIHGNVDPVREQIETVYFEGRRPLFSSNGDNILKLFENLEAIHELTKVVLDYETVHLFLIEIKNLMSPSIKNLFDHVIDDPYPGYELKVKRVTKILPSHTVTMMLPDERCNDDLY